jgi:hypothetical protein
MSLSFLITIIAEIFLNKLEQNQNFGQLVLQLIATKSYDLHIRFAASLLFKNFVRRNWMVCRNKNNNCILERGENRRFLTTSISTTILTMPFAFLCALD